MLMKRISAPTLAEAVAKTRVECGADALLVDTQKTRNGYVIVAAQPPRTVPPARAPKASARWTRGFAEIAAHGREFGLSVELLRTIERALLGTKVELGKPGDPALPRVAARMLKALIKTGTLTLPERRIAAFVGATGVGKTTTLAKLAAAATRTRGESIAILTVDTYRVAAVEQLRAFADMLAVPFGVAFTPADLRRLVREHAGADRIFIDTSGRSPFDGKALQALRAMLDPVQATTVLCLCAHARRRDALATLSAFGALDPELVVLTKWDETTAPGEALSAVVEQGLRLSHVTVGQEIPEDIVEASAGALAASALRLDDAAAEAIL
jgi:flagellar biosynthesis protein FlhF